MKIKDHAFSEVHSQFLMVALIILTFLFIFAYFMGYLNLNLFSNALAPPNIKIISINHGGAKLEGQVTIRSFASEELSNRDLQAVLYINGKKVIACIHTLNGHNFIPTHHFGVKNIGGSGCSGDFFSPGESIVIDLKNGYIRPGDVVELRIYRRSNDSSMLPIQGNLLDRKYVNDYLDENVYGSLKGYRLFSQHRYTA